MRKEEGKRREGGESRGEEGGWGKKRGRGGRVGKVEERREGGEWRGKEGGWGRNGEGKR